MCVLPVLNIYKQKTRLKTGFHCSGGWIWTSDLRVMSLTQLHLFLIGWKAK